MAWRAQHQPWLRVLARHAIHQRLAGKFDPSPSHAAVASEQRRLLYQVLDTLPEDYRQVIMLRNLDELSHSQVAERMGRSEPAVRMLWLRALAALTAAVQAPARGSVD